MLKIFTSDAELGEKLIHVSCKTREVSLPLHIHEFYEIHLILGGKIEQDINGSQHIMERGFFYFLNPFDLHEYRTIEPTSIYKCQFDLSIVGKELQNVIVNNNSCIITKLSEEQIANVLFYFEKLREEEINSEKFNKNFISLLLSSLIIELFRITPVQSLPPNIEPLEHAFQYIYQNYLNDISLEKVAAIANFSPNYFCALFKKNIGRTFKQHLKDLRMHHAVILLKTSTLNISEICCQSGYSSFPHFAADFKNFTGYTPKTYRKIFVPKNNVPALYNT